MIRNMSIKNKLLLVFIILTTMVLATAFIIMISINIKNSKDNIASVMDVVGSIIADRCAASLAFSDVESANGNLRTLSSYNSVVYACIRTRDNQVFSEYNLNVDQVFRCEGFSADENNRFRNQYFDSFKPIMLEGEAIGSLQIKVSLDAYNEEVVGAINVSVIVFAVLMLISIYIMIRITNLITNPIASLKDLANEVTEKEDYSLRMKEKADDEVGVLITTFNNMLEQIEIRDRDLLKEKENAERAALSSKRYAKETELINADLESEITERVRIEEELHQLNETLEEKVYERTRELKEMNEKIGDISRSAGMAEVANGVLHNVGNVLNSVNVSASMLRELARKTKAHNLSRVVKMLKENKSNIGEYISSDSKGKQIPDFLSLLDGQLDEERRTMFKELDELSNSIDHIKNVVSMQQSYAGSYGVREQIHLPDLVEDAIKINMEGMARRGIRLIKKYEDVPLVYLDKHKVLQIIINIISNAKHALTDSDNAEKILQLFVVQRNKELVVEVKDTGIGISEEDLAHLFEYGFKKRRGGHGYGLHHSGIVANELGGKITVESEGLGKGAIFRLILPVTNE